MNPRISMKLMLSLHVLYGAAVAILAFLKPDAIGTFAVVGAIILGALWGVRIFLIKSSNRTTTG